MTGISLTLDDLGIHTSSHDHLEDVRHGNGYPKEYDFTLHRRILGSWWQVRNALSRALDNAYKKRPYSKSLRLMVLWAVRDGDTEETVRAMLTGMDYDEIDHATFDRSLFDWAINTHEEETLRLMIDPGMPHQETVRKGLAKNEGTPPDILAELSKDPQLHCHLLANPGAGPDIVRAIHAAIKDDERAPMDLVYSTAKLPEDVLKWIAGLDAREQPEGTKVFGLLAGRPEVTETILISLFGKCDHEQILKSPACTERVRAEFDQLRPTGRALTDWQRQHAHKELKKIHKAIKTGRTDHIIRYGFAEEGALLNAVLNKPELDVHEAYCILRDNEEF